MINDFPRVMNLYSTAVLFLFFVRNFVPIYQSAIKILCSLWWLCQTAVFNLYWLEKNEAVLCWCQIWTNLTQNSAQWMESSQLVINSKAVCGWPCWWCHCFHYFLFRPASFNKLVDQLNFRWWMLLVFLGQNTSIKKQNAHVKWHVSCFYMIRDDYLN